MPRDRRVTDAVKQLAQYFGAVTDGAFIDQTWDFNARFNAVRETLAGGEDLGGTLAAAASLTRGISYSVGTPAADLIANLINGSTNVASFMSEIGAGLADYDSQIQLFAREGDLGSNTKIHFSQLTAQDFKLARATPTTENPNFYAAVVSNPFMGPMVKDTGAIEIFMNGIPTLEFSRCVPYINLELISTRRTLGTTAEPLTLLGFLNPPSLGTADRTIIDAAGIANVRSEATDLGPGIRSGIELFTAPQTLVNMGETGPEFVPVIDRLRPLASLGNLSLSTKLQGGTLSFTTGRLEIVIHDRSRLRDMAAFVRPDLYGTTFLDITHGWSHPDGGLGSSNTFGQFLDALKYKTRYRISNSSFTFEEGGQIKVTLSIQTVGSIDLLYLGPRTEGSRLQQLRQSIELINRRLEELRARGANPSLTQYDFIGSVNNPESLLSVASSKDFIKKLKELLKKGDADSTIVSEILTLFGKTVSSSASSAGSVKLAQDEIRSSYEQITATLPMLSIDPFGEPLVSGASDRFKLLGTNVVVTQNGNGTSQVGTVTARTVQQKVSTPAVAAKKEEPPNTGESFPDEALGQSFPDDEAPASDVSAERASASATVAAERGTPATVASGTASTTGSSASSTTSKAPANQATMKTVTVGPNHTVYDDGRSTSPGDFYSFGSIFMKMVAEPIAQSGQYDEVQVIFYPFNRFAGAVHDLPISCFPIEKGRFAKVIQEAATKVPDLSGRAIIQVLNNRFINFAPSRAYLMSSFYNTTSVDQGKQDPIDLKPHTVTLVGGGTFQGTPNYTLTLEERMDRAGIPERKLQLPRVEVAVEGCPLLDAAGLPVPGENGQAKTLIKIHVYDATVDPHRTLSEIITAAKDNELGMIQVPVADFNKAKKAPTGGGTSSGQTNADAAQAAALAAIKAGLESEILEGVSKETLEKITTSNEQAGSIISKIQEGTAFVRVKGDYEKIKRLVAAGMPTITYGSSASAITNASITTGGSAGLPTVMLQRAFNSPGETATENIESGVPMQILPAQLSMSTIGCPLFSPMQRFFVDFGTGTSLDSCYYVISVDSTIGADGYKTDLKMAYSAGFPTYQSLNMQLAQLAAGFSSATGATPQAPVTIPTDDAKPSPKSGAEQLEKVARQRLTSAARAVNRVKRDAEIRIARAAEREKRRLEMLAAQAAELAKRRAAAAIPESVRVEATAAAAQAQAAETKAQETAAIAAKLEAKAKDYTGAASLASDVDPSILDFGEEIITAG